MNHLLLGRKSVRPRDKEHCQTILGRCNFDIQRFRRNRRRCRHGTTKPTKCCLGRCKNTIDISSTEKIKQTTSDLIDILDVSVNLPATNAKLAVGELLLAHATEGKEGAVREIISKFGWRSNNDKNTEQPPYFDEKVVVVNHDNNPIVQCLIQENEYNLADVDVMTPDVLKKRINILFRIRRKMRDNMTLSGTHDSDPWNSSTMS
jgi:hypothetical protein